jgi:hypothetical protein
MTLSRDGFNLPHLSLELGAAALRTKNMQETLSRDGFNLPHLSPSVLRVRRSRSKDEKYARDSVPGWIQFAGFPDTVPFLLLYPGSGGYA